MQDNGYTYGGFRANTAAMLGYLLFPFAIVALALEKYNKFVRFHAMQALATLIALFLGHIIAISIPLLGCIIVPIFSVASFVAIVILMIKAYHGDMYRVPGLADFLERQFGRYM